MKYPLHPAGSGHLHVPFCEITLIDKDRPWLKSAIGIRRTEVPRQEAVCAYCLGNELLGITDTLADPLSREKPAATVARVRPTGYFVGNPGHCS